jgi:hypothetical protein
VPKKSALQRLKNYQNKLTPEGVKQALDIKIDDMRQRQRATVEELVEIEEHVQSVLAGEDVTVIQYPFYHDFARQLYRLKKKYLGGKGLLKEVELLIYIWTERELDDKVLRKIKDEVFALKEPVP